MVNKWTVTAAVTLAVLAAVLAAALPAWAQDSAPIMYAEGGTDPVTTLTATDPEDDTITWSVTSTGTEDFTIDEDGVLKFMNPPNFEAPLGGADNGSNTYVVTVTATDTATPTANMDTFTVTVEVTNVEEDGEVTWTVDADGFEAGESHTAGTPPMLLQFQPGASLMASLTDGDAVAVADANTEGTVANVRWQWYRSPSATAMGTAIDGATSATYTVQDEVDDSDVGMYLRVEASYTVVAGSAESAFRVSDYPVQMFREDNSAPEFDPTSVTREVYEGEMGMDVGNPVTGTDADGGALNYTIDTNAQVTVDGTPTDAFAINQKTGQITTALDLDYDTAADLDQASDFADVTGNAVGDNIYLVSVRATDSAGAATGGTDTADTTVAITLKNVDEKPTFTVTAGTASSPTAITRSENNTTLFDADATGGQPTEVEQVTYQATDPEGRSVPLELMGDDGSLFRLNTDSALEFSTGPDYENPTDMNGDNKYEVTVRASDGTMYADRMVTVTVINADEGPDITEVDSPIKFAEGGTGTVIQFMATDPEGHPVTWSLSGGTDDDDFAVGASDGMLTFSSTPDYENAVDDDTDNTYEITVVASSTASGGTPITANSEVTVEVTNVAEDGMITWTVDPDGDGTLTPDAVNGEDPIVQFQPGAILTVTELTDGDVSGASKTIDAANTTWQWYRSSSKTSQGSPISDATTNAYTVQDETNNNDVGRYIRVVASYSVVAGDSSTAYRVSDHPVQRRLGENNSAPEFDPDEVDREVTEGMAGMTVGAPVRATDADRDALNYMLAGTGADNAKFEIDPTTGQITTMWGLNREGTAEATTDTAGTCAGTPATECTVTVTVTDSAGATDEATVTITITNVDEKPTFTTAGDALSPTAIRSPENDTALYATGRATADGFVDAAAGVTYAATDEDGNLVNLSLMGDDGDLFTLNAGTGGSVLAFAAAPDFENPTDMNGDNKYEVTVRASDGTMHDDRMVTVTVTDVNEAPEIIQGGLGISGMSSVPIEEGSGTAVAMYTASGPEAASARWSLSGDDMGDFRISSSGGALTFGMVPDYEDPQDADTNNVYMVTVIATDSERNMAEREVTVTVTNMEEDGTVTLSPMTAVVGTEITATLMDPDDGVTGESWQWSQSATMDGTFEDITGVTSASYTPVDEDNGDYLMATVMYTDGYGEESDMASSDPVMVSSTPPDPNADLIARYDTNGTAGIQKDEVITAINDYLFGEGDDRISKAEVIELINLYLFG